MYKLKPCLCVSKLFYYYFIHGPTSSSCMTSNTTSDILADVLATTLMAGPRRPGTAGSHAHSSLWLGGGAGSSFSGALLSC
jgi:hypothetical protein